MADVSRQFPATQSVESQSPAAKSKDVSVISSVLYAVLGTFLLATALVAVQGRQGSRDREHKYRMKAVTKSDPVFRDRQSCRTIRGFFDSVIPDRFSPDLWHRKVLRRCDPPPH